MWMLLVALSILCAPISSDAFTARTTRTCLQAHAIQTRCSRCSMTSREDDGEQDDFSMASLKSRLQEVQDLETQLPLVVLDAMLPRQLLKIQVKNTLLMDLVRDCLRRERPMFGMLGMVRLKSGDQIHITSGVEVEILKDHLEFLSSEDGSPSLKLALKAGRRFKIEGNADTASGGWTMARVRYLDSQTEEESEIEPSSTSDPTSVARAMVKAKEFTSPNMNMPNNLSLVDRWLELARENERQQGQIDALLECLGEIPPADQPTERSLWVGALINPLPAMGVAMEIRPSLLTTEKTEDRVEIALDGILRSIKHMDGSAKLW